MLEKKKRTMMSFDITPERKRLIKISAATWNITVCQWINSALEKELKRQLVETPKE